MLVLQRPIVKRDLWIEIESRWSIPPAGAADLDKLGIVLLGQSRIVRIEDSSLAIDTLAVLANPLTEDLHVATPAVEAGGFGVDVFCHAGVTDAEGEVASQALRLTGAGDVRCHAGIRFRFAAHVDPELRGAIGRLLGNPLIHTFHWHDDDDGEVAVRHEPAPIAPVQYIYLQGADVEELRDISRRLGLALDATEMAAIVDYFAGLGRSATDVELQSIALAWSEHCSHKTFKAPICFEHNGTPTVIDGLLRECLVEPMQTLNRRWIRSAFVDNAGVIAFDRRFDLAFKVETHNHPSALEPFGGAHTGVGGVIRDVLAVSAEPIANTDVLCFGPPDLAADDVPPGVFHPSRTLREVVRGIGDYGNNMGIPTVAGAVLFHPGYTANPLVYCGTLGIAPRGSHPSSLQPGDRVVLLGGRTGRDGLHGATMSSETLDRETVQSSTVQIGAPIVEKGLRDVLPHLRDERLYHAITDCGAGGLCSAVGEMGQHLGVDVDLNLVPLKYEGLTPWEIWLSEAQERMVLAVEERCLPGVHEMCQAYGVEATVIGRFRDDGRLLLTYDGAVVADLAMTFLHDGRPVRTLDARWEDTVPTASPRSAAPRSPTDREWRPQPRSPVQRSTGTTDNHNDALLRLLALPTIASKEAIVRRFDHEVGAATVGKPLTADGGPADAAVLQPLAGSWRGAILAHGINALYGAIDPYAMALLAVDEALRNLVAAGGSIDRTVLLDNFCWGDVDDPVELGALVRAAQGCKDASLGYRVPFISGKDSLRNTSVDDAGRRHSIPRTLLISALGIMPDVRRRMTMDLKCAGSRLYLLGQTGNELGGSQWNLLQGIEGEAIPQVRVRESRRLMRALTRAIRRGLLLSCHDLSEGGLGVAAAEMALAGAVGLELDLDRVNSDAADTDALLFAESSGRFLVEVAEEQAEEFERMLAGTVYSQVGTTHEAERIVVRRGDETVIDLPIDQIEHAWKTPLSADFALTPAEFDAESPLDGAESSPLVDHPAKASTSPSMTAGTRSAPHRRAAPRAMVLAAAGINCDRETVEACRLAGAATELVHLNQVLSGDVWLRDFGLLVLPGGFSYGDHLGAGAMLAAVLRHRLLGELVDFITDGRPVLGICNGFQALSRLGLLGPVSLAPNASGRFQCRWERLRVVDSPCPFLLEGETIELPIAHGEGRVITAPQYLPELLARSPLRYVDNPNGSVADIAAVCNDAGNVLGLMPHPERFVARHHHPRQTAPEPFGLTIFRRALHLAATL